MNAVDVAIFALFLGLYTGAFLAGIRRTVLILLAWFLTMVLTSLFTRPLTQAFREIIPAMALWASELFALVVIVAVLSIALVSGGLWSTKNFLVLTRRWFGREYGAVGVLLQALLAMILAVVFLGTLVMISTYTALQMPQDAIGNRLRSEIGSSSLVPAVREVEPWLHKLVIDWVPGEPPSIFGGVVTER